MQGTLLSILLSAVRRLSTCEHPKNGIISASTLFECLIRLASGLASWETYNSALSLSFSLFLSLSLSFSVAKRWRFRGHCEIWHLCVGPAKSLGCETESSLVLSASVNQPLFRNQVSQGGRAWRRARPGRRLTSLSVNLYSTPVWIEHGLSSTSSRVTRQNGPFATLKFRHRLIRKKNWIFLWLRNNS